MYRREQGITLIELMVVVVVIAIIASVAVPSYRNYVVRTHRTEATSSLLQVRSAQEKFFMQNSRYATNAELTLAPPAGLGVPSPTTGGRYTLTIPAQTATTYTARAVPLGAQLSDDTQCQQFNITEQGVRTSSPAADTVCWR